MSSEETPFLSPQGRWLFFLCRLMWTAARINDISRGMCLKEVRLRVDRVISFLFVERFGEYEVFSNVSPVGMLVHIF